MLNDPSICSDDKRGAVDAEKKLHRFEILDDPVGRTPVKIVNQHKTHQSHHDFLDAVGLEQGETIIGDQVSYDAGLEGPDGSYGVYYYSLPRDYPFSFVARVHTVLAASMPLLDDNLAFHIQAPYLRGLQSDLPLFWASRIPLVFDADVAPDTGFLALNPGEGYGLLRKLEPGDRPNPRDVVIYEALPNDLPRVAGIISTVPQTPLSHVNLRAVQDDIPNAFIRDALDDGNVTALIGSYVRYTVTEARWRMRAATRAEIDAHYDASRPARAQTPQRDRSVRSITPLSEIRFADWNAFGVKAANLAVLRTLGFPEGTVPDGFAVPFYFYDEFMKANGLYDDIKEMLAEEDFQTDFEVQDDMLDDLRDNIKDAETPEWIREALTAMHETFPEGRSLRYRSSTNNEDLPGFNGAGLYDSKTQHRDETEEDGIDKSLKQVYASLWNFRAFTEREFHRIDHLAAAMGVLVHPNYSDEKANGVAVSFNPIFGRVGGYYVNTQVGEDLVTNPKAHSVPEEILLGERSTTVLGTSNQVPPGQLLMTNDQLDQLRRHLTVIHDHFKELHKPRPGEPFAMEIEFKITSDNILAIKQARPWVFSAASAPPEGGGDGGGGGGGGGGSGGGRRRRSNRPPEAVGTLADRSLTVASSPVSVDVASAFDDPDDDELTYAASSSAEEVAVVAATGSMVTVTPVGAGTAVLTVTAADGEASNAPATQIFTVTVVVDYDADADGLIEVRTLAQLDALRHDLDGDGVPAAAGELAHAAAFAGAVGGLLCAGAACRGYELVADLDFDTNGSGGLDAGDAYWNDGSGWLPIGTAAEPFEARLEGYGRVIRHLFIAGAEGAGLFGATGASSVVARVGLLAADVAGTQGVGALAGRNGGRVTGCWATGRVSGAEAVGGLVGANAGDIGGSYAAARVSGDRQVGGLVGVNDGDLRAVHATGRVSGTAQVGGLVGHHRGMLAASYATGRVRGEREAGGLVGATEPPGTVTAAYWDTDTAGLQSSAAGRGLTTAALQRPTAYGGLYAAWNVDADGDGVLDGPWHFGTSAQYPVLYLDVDGDGRASWQELGRQLRAGPQLTAMPAALPAEVVLTWTAVDTSAWTPAPAVTYTVTRESGSTVETVAAEVSGARYVDADMQPGAAYTYQVAAVVDGGEAARSALVTAETKAACAFTVTPLHRDVLWTAGTEQVTVTTAPDCAWTAASESAFLAVTAGASGASGAGPTTVSYTVATNGGGPRTGSLQVAGQQVTVYQASATVFTDHPIERGVAPVKAIHFRELRARIDALRQRANRPAFGWTDPVLTPGGTPISHLHLTDLRAALGDAYSAASRTAPTYTDPVVTAGATVIRAAHLMELRAAVAALE